MLKFEVMLGIDTYPLSRRPHHRFLFVMDANKLLSSILKVCLRMFLKTNFTNNSQKKILNFFNNKIIFKNSNIQNFFLN